MKKHSLIVRIFGCLILGILLGLGFKQLNFELPIRLLITFSSLFSSFLSFIIPLIIIAFIVPGIASLGGSSGKGLLFTTIIAYISTVIAGTLAFICGKLMLSKLISHHVLADGAGSNLEPLFPLEIPPVMGIMSALVLAFVLGIGLSKMKNSPLLKVMEDFNLLIAGVVAKVIIPIVPLYIGCLFAKLSYSGEIFSTLKSFAIVYIVLFALQVSYLLIQYTLAGIVKHKNPISLLKNMVPAYLTAVGTQSSAATIPVNMQCVKNNEVREEVADFVVPLCATIHLAGDTIAIVLSSMAVMFMNGQTPTIAVMFPFILMLGVTMIAAPGVPGGGVMAALGLLESMLGFGALEKPLMIALHAAQDSFGTATNVTGDGAIAILIERLLPKETNESI